jgi:23S rRNA (uracil1939-C5)-methyltransferase
MSRSARSRPGQARPDNDDDGAVLTVERLVPGGLGLCRADDGVVFVDGVAAGDVVRVAREGRRGGVGRGRLLDLVRPSPERRGGDDVAADCAVAAACGGCDWLHLTGAARAHWKVAIALDALRRVGRFDDHLLGRVVTPLVSGEAEDRLRTGRRRARVTVGAGGAATFSAARSHDRVVVPACRALHPRLEEAVLRLPRAALPSGLEVRLAVDDRGHVAAAVNTQTAARALVAAGVVDGVVVPRRDGSAAGGDDLAIVGDATLVGEITAGRYAARHDAATFSQATRHGGAAIIDAVMAAVDDVVAGAVVLELFSGAGHLTLPLAAQAARVVAIEGDARSVRHLRENRRLVVEGERRIEARVAFIDASLALPVADIVVVDPPRTGLVDGAALAMAWAAMRVRRVVMVSCDPASGARDLRAVVDAGFRLERLVPIDAFPRTHHLEWVATLSRA